MIPTGQRYYPTGQFEFVGAIIASIFAILLGIGVAAIIWLWYISPIPRLVFITEAVQGAAIGFSARYLFRKARLRNPTLAAIIGGICGALSVFLVHYGLYVNFVYEFKSAVVDRVNSSLGVDNRMTSAKALAITNSNPYLLADELVLYPKTGHHNFPGFMIIRDQAGETIGHAGASGANISGGILWGLWVIEAAAVIGFAAFMSRQGATEPFCEDCGQWFNKPRTTLMLPPTQIAALTTAVNSGDPQQVAAIDQSVKFDAGRGSTSAALHECSQCDQILVDVVLTTPTKKKGQFNKRKSIVYLSISKEMTAALQPRPTQAQVPPAA
jgi:hypothetical protein